MMLGKRARPPMMKKTTSMTEFTLDLNAEPSFDPFTGSMIAQRPLPAAAASSKLHRHNSMDSSQTAHFLRVCFLCKRRLVGDIYMYRGDSAFCSLECRQRKINQDESKDKCSSVKN